MTPIRPGHLIRGCVLPFARLGASAWLGCVLLALAVSAVPRTGSAQPAPIAIGMSTPLTGPTASYGKGLAQGVRAGLAHARGGGLEARRVELLVRDDGGDPQRTMANTRELLQAGVVALTGYHGARPLEAALPLLDARGSTPMVGAASSAESLRTPPRRWLFNLRAAAGDETAAMVFHLDTIGIGQIAVIAQDDGLGRAGVEGMEVELARISVRPVAIARVSAQAGQREIEDAVETVCKASPQAALLALDARNALLAIRQARQRNCRPQFYLLSEAGSDLAAQGASPAEIAGVVVSQVLPSPERPAHPLAAEFMRDVPRDPAVSRYAALEGYLYGRVLAESLRVCARTPVGDCMIAAIEGGRVEVPGYRLKFGAQERRGSRFVELTLIGADGRLHR